jgi:hypothetical protein
MEASGKMTRRQFQVFREELKVGRRKQKLPAKRAILEVLREPVEPSNWCVPFFLSIVFYWVYFLFIELFLFFVCPFYFIFCLLPHDWVCDQKLYPPTFSPSRVGTRLETNRALGASRERLDPYPFLTERDRYLGRCERRCWAGL